MKKLLKHKAHKIVDIEPGMCIVFPGLPYPDDHYIPSKDFKPDDATCKYRNKHPYLILSVTKETAECIYTGTLDSKDENKRRRWYIESENGSDTAFLIEKPHPPMEDPKTRIQFADAGKITYIPLEKIWDNPELKICNDGGIKIDQNELIRIKEAVKTINKTVVNLDTIDPWNTNYETYMTKEEYRKAYPDENPPSNMPHMRELERCLRHMDETNEPPVTENPDFPEDNNP